MNFVLRNETHALISFDLVEVRQVCDASRGTASIDTSAGIRSLLTKIESGVHRPVLRSYQRMEVWSDGGSVQMISVTAFGDPVDLSTKEAREFANRLNAATLAAQA